MVYLSFAVALCALLLSWMNFRRGKLQMTKPAFVAFCYDVGKDIQALLINTTVETLFGAPQPFERERLSNLGAKLVHALGIRPNDASLNVRDALYNYELKVTLFRGQGTIKVGPEKAEMSVQDIHSESDMELVKTVFLKASSVLKATDTTTTYIQANIHLNLITGDRAKFFAAYFPVIGDHLLQGGIIYRNIQPFLPDIRVQLERSNLYPGALFFNWTGGVKGLFTAAVYEEVQKEIIASLDMFKLAVPPSKK